jgi:hypothetical protein
VKHYAELGSRYGIGTDGQFDWCPPPSQTPFLAFRPRHFRRSKAAPALQRIHREYWEQAKPEAIVDWTKDWLA